MQLTFKASARDSTFLPCLQPPAASLDPPPSFPVAANLSPTVGSVAPDSGETAQLLVLLFQVLEIIPFPSRVVWPIACVWQVSPWQGTSPVSTSVFLHLPCQWLVQRGACRGCAAEGTAPVQLSFTPLPQSHSWLILAAQALLLPFCACRGGTTAPLGSLRSPLHTDVLVPSRAPAQPLSWRRNGQSSLDFVSRQGVVISMALIWPSPNFWGRISVVGQSLLHDELQ